MRTWHYRYSGLHLCTELPLPEWEAYEIADSGGEPEIWIRQGAAESEPLRITMAAQEYVFTVAGICTYQVCDGCAIQVWPVAGVDPRNVRLYLLSAAWAAVLYQRNQFPLHAAIVRVGNEAVAFCGISGAGKSTAAAWLVERGYQPLSDDLCRCVMPAEGLPLIWRSTPRLRLTETSLNLIGRSKAGLVRTANLEDKFHLPWPGSIQDDVLPLRAIYLLVWGETRLTRLTGLAAVERLVAAASYHHVLLEAMGLLPLQWQRCIALVKRLPIWEFSRPHQGTTLDEAMQHLVEHWKNLD